MEQVKSPGRSPSAAREEGPRPRLRHLAFLLPSLLLMHPSAGQTLHLPPRAVDAPSRDELIQALSPLSRELREDSLFGQIASGNVPEFMRTLVPVSSSASIGGTLYSITYYVTPDYFAVGSDGGYFLIPMTPLLAQRIADSLKCTLPTRKMVNDIYAAAPLKLAPQPIPPSPEMITVPVFAQHDSMVWAQRSPQLGSFPLGTLIGGTKKDVVISNKIRSDLKAGVPKPVVIYGWHQLNGVPIQPLYNGHGETYADYSHGIRLVQEDVQLNGSPTTISAILEDPTLSGILSDEGPIPIPRYGDSPTDLNRERDPAPRGTVIFQNYPNPFNPRTIISGEWVAESRVKLVVYDILGRAVATLADGLYPAGRYSFAFDGRDLSSGVYLYRFSAGRVSSTRPMMLVK